ncbi:GroES-like protein [Peniophora sp. CONT]|nr:GroES-like protein [Peniophora sp. CONT]
MSLPSQQKALLLSRYGPDAAYELGERAVPQPGAGQVLIRNAAVALNPLDAVVRVIGLYVSEYGMPAVAGYDAAGTIAALGSDVQGWAVGDVVLYQGWFKADYGAFQEYTLSEASLIARVPSNITIEEAATIPSAIATAACALYNTPGPHSLGLTAPWEEGGRGKYASQAALVIGGSGSVGQLALQMLKLSGYSPIIATASSSNEAYCKRAGATHVIDYKTTPYETLPSKVAELLNGAPLALAYDAISVPESQKAAWTAIAPGSKLVLVLPSVLGDDSEKAGSGKTMVMAHGMFKTEENVEIGKRLFGLIPGLLESGDVKPNQIEVIPGGLKGIISGIERLEAKKVSGAKLIVHPRETA